ncbi:MAG: YdcF family protein, partial [Acidobacteriota bacterium]
MNSKPRNRRLWPWALLLALAVLSVVFQARILGALGARLVQAGPPQKADAALVLAGDGWGFRILTAAQLERDGFVPKVLVSGPDGAYGLHECDLAIPFAMKRGYPESYFVHLEHSARSTQTEAEAVLPVIRSMGVKRLIVVTSNFHTRRAGAIFRKLAPDLTIMMVAAPDKNFTADGWWHSREGQKTFLMEWEKTVS